MLLHGSPKMRYLDSSTYICHRIGRKASSPKALQPTHLADTTLINTPPEYQPVVVELPALDNILRTHLVAQRKKPKSSPAHSMDG